MLDHGGSVIIGSDQSLDRAEPLHGCMGAIAQLSKSLAAHYAPKASGSTASAPVLSHAHAARVQTSATEGRTLAIIQMARDGACCCRGSAWRGRRAVAGGQNPLLRRVTFRDGGHGTVAVVLAPSAL